MPIYIYENTKTGKVWEENLPYEDRDKPVNKNTIRIPAATNMLRVIDSNEDKLRNRLGMMVERGYQERDYLESKGLIKVPTKEKERREKSKQKRKWV
jgi:ribosomal protein L28